MGVRFRQVSLYTENGLQNPNNIPQHFMCEFRIILHIVLLSVGLTFTAGVYYTYIIYLISILHGLYYVVHLTPSGNKHK
jgi:hypothetical protein